MEHAMTDARHTALITAASFFNDSARKLLTIEGRLHADTLIASVSRMAGSLLYRSFGFDASIAPGTTVLSDLANIQGPKLMNTMFATLHQLGHQLGEEHLNRDYASPTFSQLTFTESHDRLAPFFLHYCKAAPMDFADAAIAAAIASGILVHDCREVLSVDKGGAIAIYGFVEGTKTAPPSLGQAGNPATHPDPPEKKKPWYKLR